MDVALGIDTGGTYTDAVLVDHATGQVLAGAKALTTRHNLAVGIQEAIAAVFAARAGTPEAIWPADIVLVGLSTTLATNAMVEGQGGPVCLLLIGYDPELMKQYGFERELGTADFVYVRGGHNEQGDEAAPLDEAALRSAVLAHQDTVEAFAVSGYFSVRDPAHELRARAIIQELTGLPTTCGHELSSQLNAVRRATTAALNARADCPFARADDRGPPVPRPARHRRPPDGRQGRRVAGAGCMGDAPAHRDDPFWPGRQRGGRLAPGRPPGCVGG